MVTLRLNVDEAIRIAAQAAEAGVIRTAMLIAHGWNCSIEACAADFHLEGFIQFINAPRDLTPEQMEAFRADYRAWVVGNGIQELVAALEPLLDTLHAVIAHGVLSLKKMHARDVKKACRQFEQLGLASKLEKLKNLYGVDADLSGHYETLTKARNCLTHRGGIVADKDCNAEGRLRITWLGFDSSITEGSGREHVLTLDTIGPIDSSKFEGEGNPKLNISWTDRAVEFFPGERIYVSPRQLQEICHMGSLTCFRLRQRAINWFLDNGIYVNNGVPVPEPTVEIYLDLIAPGDSEASRNS